MTTVSVIPSQAPEHLTVADASSREPGSRLHALRSVIQMSFEASVARRKSRRDTLSAVLCARPSPWHEIINARGRPQIDQFGQDVLDIGLRINTVELAGLDQRGD